VGFESFWLGERLRQIGELYWWQANEAHNGYLEIYLNLGVIGVFILVGWLIATFRRSQSEFITDFEFGRFRLSFFIAALIYNWTESGFRSLHPVWFVFFIIALEYPKFGYESAVESSGVAALETEMVYAEDEA
jgi:exopolysaccharide production protein ExoQ